MNEEPPIMREEIAGAIKAMAEGKPPAYDCVSGEELKASDEAGIDVLHKLCNFWTKETFLEDWGRLSSLISLKKKDNA